MNPNFGEHLATYKQYKADTEYIAGWLAMNAQNCGYNVATPLSNASPTPAATTRLKGKARKQARNAAKPVVTESAGTTTKYTIRVSDFNPMAKAIAEFRPKVNIPKALDNLFNRAIEARNICTQWYRENAHGDSESNDRHVYFTNVLKTAWETLRPSEQARTSHINKPAPVVVAQSSEPGTFPSLLNHFSGLEIDHTLDLGPKTQSDCSDAGDSNKDNNHTDEGDDYRLKDILPVSLAKNEEDTEYEFRFAIFSFMKELDRVRAVLRKVWSSYAGGVMELMCASLLTNTAIQLVRRAEHELDLMIQRPKKYPDSLYPTSTFPGILVYQCHQHSLLDGGRSLDSLLQPLREMALYDCEHARLCMWETYNALNHSLWELEQQGAQYLLSGNVNPNAPEKFRRIKSMLPDFQAVSQGMDKCVASDEITLGLGTMFKTKKISIWVTFAVEVLLDAQDELRTVPRKALNEVQQHARIKFSELKSGKVSQAPFAEVEKAKECLASLMSSYESDVLGDNFRNHVRNPVDGMRNAESGLTQNIGLDNISSILDLPHIITEPYHYLSINPVKCGLLKYGIYMQSHNYAAIFEGSWRGLTSMVHLYVACRSLYPEDPVWPDMEHFLHYQDLGRLFFGGVPKSMDEACKKVLLANGATVRNFARNRRSSQPRINENKGRWVSNPCVFDNIFMNWISGNEAMTDNMISDLVRTINDPKVIAEKARQASNVMSTPEIKELSQSRLKPDRSIPAILGTMAFFIKTESNELYFDWLSFAESCQRIWGQIRNTLKEETGKSFEPVETSMVLSILQEARACQCMAEGLGEDVDTSRKAMKVVSEGGERLEDTKAWVGDQQLFRMMSKRLDESTYPSLSSNLIRDRLYKNWSLEEINHSAVLRMNGGFGE
ncbi:hypothetical protein F4778DRAFT_795844 [Xylariomycetidae sp. FL2044]|nr:hypothetical protein F4778DRAFT_795844 [Xylariomycetidae sp. FL2044]